jgi:hypothetical protein
VDLRWALDKIESMPNLHLLESLSWDEATPRALSIVMRAQQVRFLVPIQRMSVTTQQHLLGWLVA